MLIVKTTTLIDTTTEFASLVLRASLRDRTNRPLRVEHNPAAVDRMQNFRARVSDMDPVRASP